MSAVGSLPATNSVRNNPLHYAASSVRLLPRTGRPATPATATEESTT